MQRVANGEPTSVLDGECPPDHFLIVELFGKLRKYAARWHLDEIDKLKAPISDVSHWPVFPDNTRSLVSISRKVRESSLMTIGLADYMLSQYFVQTKKEPLLLSAGVIIKRDPNGVMHMLEDYNLDWIDFRIHRGHVRQRLIEIGGSRINRYAFIDPETWRIKAEFEFSLPTHADDENRWNNARKQVAGVSGAFLILPGKLPSEKEVAKLLGDTKRFTDKHMAELVAEARIIYTTSHEGLFSRASLSSALGLDDAPRPFNVVWKALTDTLSRDEKTALTKPGRRKAVRLP